MSEVAKNTAGPWAYEIKRGPRSAYGTTSSIGIYSVSKLEALRGADDDSDAEDDVVDECWVCGIWGDCSAEDEANARLIASAPDLLQALEGLLHAYSEPDRRLCCDGRDCGCMGSTVHQQAEHYARAAIAKAEGLA